MKLEYASEQEKLGFVQTMMKSEQEIAQRLEKIGFFDWAEFGIVKQVEYGHEDRFLTLWRPYNLLIEKGGLAKCPEFTDPLKVLGPLEVGTYFVGPMPTADESEAILGAIKDKAGAELGMHAMWNQRSRNWQLVTVEYESDDGPYDPEYYHPRLTLVLNLGSLIIQDRTTKKSLVNNTFLWALAESPEWKGKLENAIKEVSG
jgi:hypothetical protein